MKHEKEVVQSLLKSRVQEHSTTVQFQDIWAKYKIIKSNQENFKWDCLHVHVY